MSEIRSHIQGSLAPVEPKRDTIQSEKQNQANIRSKTELRSACVDATRQAENFDALRPNGAEDNVKIKALCPKCAAKDKFKTYASATSSGPNGAEDNVKTKALCPKCAAKDKFKTYAS